MKKSIIFSAAIIVLGAFIAFGPQFLFPVCDPAMPATATTVSNAESAEDAAAAVVDDCCAVPEESDCCGTSQKSYPVCHWSARAELGLGFLIIALGLCMLVFCDPKTQLGLALGTFFASFIAIAIPNALIGGCDSLDMICHKTTFPALTAISIVLLVCSAAFVVLLELGNRKSK